MTVIDQATDIPLPECELRVTCGRDGVWLHLLASSGKAAALHFNSISAAGGTGVIAAAIRDWCTDRQKQTEQIRADNGQFGVGA